MAYAVIVDNGGGPNLEYHDVEGQEYTFRFNNVLEPGTKVIYYRSGLKPETKHLKRLMRQAHYFATATIGEVTKTDNGNYRAEILDYEQFKYGVPFSKEDGTNWEGIGNYQWIIGVRIISKEIYDQIVAQSHIKPEPKEPKKRISPKKIPTTRELLVGKEGSPFYNKQYKIVTSLKGYWIQSLSDGVYYFLAPIVKDATWKTGVIRIMKSSSNDKLFTIIHDDDTMAQVGFITIIEHGVLFSPYGKSEKITIMM